MPLPIKWNLSRPSRAQRIPTFIDITASSLRGFLVPRFSAARLRKSWALKSRWHIHQLMNPSHGSCIFPAKPTTSTTLSGLELSLDSGGFQATSRPLHLDPAFSTLPECCGSKATKAAVFPLTTSSMKLLQASRLDHTLVAAAGASLFAGIICHICGY